MSFFNFKIQNLTFAELVALQPSKSKESGPDAQRRGSIKVPSSPGPGANPNNMPIGKAPTVLFPFAIFGKQNGNGKKPFLNRLKRFSNVTPEFQQHLQDVSECTPDCWKGIGPNSEPFELGADLVLVSVLLAQILNIEESMLGDSGWLWFG
ncbi:hypothetical protein FB45DRAFT_1105502 [Roridomyces roridus]|uniref:Uncharacterized protein n=1 Tax=Roridomyces roridus TaxID=1738132 RepID=A0AAD7BBH3_9AGAR|nr:hypothetical protein FB45DRAFT_1105502 [Roridomyces roridus]